MKLILDNQVAVIEGDTHHAKWVEECGRLDHDRSVDPLVNYIPVGGVVVDGGANIGTLTKMFLDRVGCRGLVYAFEPNAEAWTCLRHNCPQALVWWCGLSDKPGVACIVKESNAGATHLRHAELHEVAGDSGPPLAQVKTLDQFELDRLDFLKLDIEGFETRALRGAEQTIRRCKPMMFIEVNRGALQRAGSSEGELLDLIASFGYAWQTWQPECRRGDPQYDVLCELNH